MTRSRVSGARISSSRLGLREGPGRAVEDEAPGAGVGLGEALADHLHDQLVGDELALVHERLRPAGRARCAHLTAARSMSPVETCGTT